MYQLKVNQQQSIIALHEQGWSRRRIARELGLDRGTVGKYLVVNSKSATNPQTGSGEAASKPATNPQTGSATVSGPASLCDPWREQIEAALERGLSIQRIYQDLVAGHQFGGVTATVAIDNLKAGVLQADWYDPQLHPKLEEFAKALRHGHFAHQTRHAAAQGQGGIIRQVCAEQRAQGPDV
jgi:hypothetical protein